MSTVFFDCLPIVAGDRRSDSVRTQGLFFVQDPAAEADAPPLFGNKGRPQDLLVFAGFVADVDFEDIDADGLRDLVVASVRPDLLDQLRSTGLDTGGPAALGTKDRQEFANGLDRYLARQTPGLT